MATTHEELLSIGLQKGFAGKSNKSEVDRGGFKFEVRDLEFDSGVYTYHDEWTGNRAAGGQEVISTEYESITRVYAGGTIPIESLQVLGLEKKDVIGILKTIILKHSNNIRLYKDFEIELIDDKNRRWRYEYKVIDSNPEIPLTTGKETIYFGGDEKIVFAHTFSICPIEG